MRSRLALFFAAKSQHIQNPVEKNSSSLLSTKSFSLSFPVVSDALSLSLSLSISLYLSSPLLFPLLSVLAL